jgi:mannose-1-phosphate guanylyltransferase / phosphomannomutase
MKAVIMAGGEGTRLRPLTSGQPKPMLPLANRPMMEHVVNLLREHGFDEIVVTLAFMPNAVRNYFGDGSEFGVRMVYATEEVALGTAGSVKNAAAELDEPFLVISGDVLTDVNLTDVVKAHRERNALATIALKSMDNPLEFGIVITKENGEVERFLEKPNWGQVFSDTVNTGIYVLDPAVLDHIPQGEVSDFSSDIFPSLLSAGEAIYGHVVDGYWEDVGTLPAYLKAHQDVLDAEVSVNVPGFRLENGVWLGEGAEVSPDASVEGPAVIGSYSTVGAGVRLGSYVVLGANVRLGANSDLERSVVHDNCYIADSVQMRGTVLGRSVDVRRGARCDEGVVVGDETFLGEHAELTSDVRIYPHKEVENGAVVNSSVIWETRASRNLFGRLGIAGLANVDITPELAVRVAMAFASTLEKGTTVSASRDSSRAARSLVRAMVAGLNAAGANVLDLEVTPVPVTRFQVRSQRSQAGITVRLAHDDPESVVMRFFDEEGHDIDEAAQRKIERAYHREDFRRVAASEIGDIGYPSRSIEYYTEALVATVPLQEIRESKFKVVLDYAYGSPSFVMPSLLSKFDAEVLTVNPFNSTRAMLQFDRHEHAARVAALVQASGAHMGAIFDPDGEQLMLVDDNGHVLSDDQARLVLLTLVGMIEGRGHTVALPVSAPDGARQIAEVYGLDIVWTKLSRSDLMEKSAAPGVVFGASDDGGYIFPSFLPAFDSMSAFVNALGLLARSGVRLSEIVDKLPQVHIAREAVSTPWEQKGVVMRQLVESIRDKDVVLVDGVKVTEDDGWALILPDPDRPLTHVIAEGPSGRDARTIAQRYVRSVRQAMPRI